MGYTHYFYRAKKDFDQTTWNVFISECKKMVKALPKTIDGEPLVLTGCSRYKIPLFNKDQVYFNGGSGAPRTRDTSGTYYSTDNTNLGHETFSIQRKYTKGAFDNSSDSMQFDCCKTARKPYDLAVMLVLMLYKYYFKDDVRVSSDGDWDGEWKIAQKYFAEMFPCKAMELLLDGKSIFN